MDWNLAIERNREALRRVLAALVAMAGLGDGGRAILPRHLHRAVLRLLRPAESAARRLVIVVARSIVVSPSRRRKANAAPPREMGSTFMRKPGGTGILMPAGVPPQADLSRPVRRAALPLFDPPRRLERPWRPAANGIPRISVPGLSAPAPVAVRRPPSPCDPIDATRLALRLAALASALDDLPRHARRFARWRAAASARDAAGAQGKRSHAARLRRPWPLRFGRPPGQRSPDSRRPAHQVHDVLADLQWFARRALEHPDTS